MLAQPRHLADDAQLQPMPAASNAILKRACGILAGRISLMTPQPWQTLKRGLADTTRPD